jgi:hypothetical protein
VTTGNPLAPVRAALRDTLLHVPHPPIDVAISSARIYELLKEAWLSADMARRARRVTPQHALENYLV